MFNQISTHTPQFMSTVDVIWATLAFRKLCAFQLVNKQTPAAIDETA